MGNRGKNHSIFKALLLPTPVLTGSGSLGMISARLFIGHPYFFERSLQN